MNDNTTSTDFMYTLGLCGYTRTRGYG